MSVLPNQEEYLRSLTDGQSMDFDMDRVWRKIEHAQKRRRYPIWLMLAVLGCFSTLVYGLCIWLYPGQDLAHETAIHQERFVEVSTPSVRPIADMFKEWSCINEEYLRNNTYQPNLQLQEVRINPTLKRAPVSNSRAPKKREADSSMTYVSRERSANAVSKNSPSAQVMQQHRAKSHKASPPNSASTRHSTQLSEEINKLTQLSIEPLTLIATALPQLELKTQTDWSQCQLGSPWSIGLEVYGGYVRPNISHASKLGEDGPLFAEYAKRWGEVESVIGGFHAGIGMLIQSPNRFQIAAGLEYMRWAERLSLEQTIEQQIRTYDPRAHYYIDSMNNVIWVGDTVCRTQTTYHKQISGKQRTLVNIPIRVGFEWSDSQWSLGGHVGANISILHSYRGPVLREDGSIIELTPSNMHLFYKTRLGVSYLADIQLSRRFSDHWSVFIRPEFRFSPTGWQSGTSDLTFDVQMATAQLGLQYDL